MTTPHPPPARGRRRRPALRDPEVRLHLGIAVCGVLLAAWTVIPHGLWHHTGYLFLLAPLADYAVRLRRAGTRSPREGGPRGELRDGLRTFSLAVPLLIYVAWGKALGMDPLVLLGSILFFVGLTLFAGSLSDPAVRHLMGWGLGLMLGGLAMPYAAPGTSVSADAIIGGVLLLGGAWAGIGAARRLLTRAAPSATPTGALDA